MRRFIIFLLSIWFANQNLKSQYITSYIPPSPNAASMTKFGTLPVNYYTGTPEISIPIYNIELQEVNIPIKLSYHASGIKVEEVASNVGLGWNLAATAVITRIVKGLPDETESVGYLFSATSSTLGYGASQVTKFINNKMGTEERAYFLKTIQAGHMDAEPDLYRLSLFGRNITFILDGKGKPMITTDEKLKILGDTQIGFTITDENGIIYEFGGVETTQVTPHYASIHSYDHTSGIGDDYSYNSAWHLTQIKTSSGRLINFSYAGTELSIDYPAIETAYKAYGDIYSLCWQGWHDYSYNQTTTNTLKLESIYFEGNSIDFEYSFDRLDIYDKCLTKISVSNKLGKILEYELKYHNSSKRPILEEVQETGIKEGNRATLPAYKLYYYADDLLPFRDSKGQDNFGYYNGKYNTTLIPGDPYYFPNGADRTTDFNFSKIGSLSSLKYPTGGTTEFVYEPNDYGFIRSSYIPSERILEPRRMHLALNPTTGTPDQLESDAFEIVDDGNGADGQYVSLDVIMEGPAPGLVNIGIKGLEHGGWVWKASGYNYHVTSYKLFLPTGQYKIAIFADEADWAVGMNVDYKTPSEQTFKKKAFGGQRIKEIKNYTANGNLSFLKRFEYIMDDEPDRSSGVIMALPGYDFEKEFIYPRPQPYSEGINDCIFKVRRAVSLKAMEYTQGALVGYKEVHVFESAGDNNGKTVYKFTSAFDYPDIEFNSRPLIPNYSLDYKRGLLLERTDYKMQPDKTFTPILTEKNEYSFFTTPPSTSTPGVAAERVIDSHVWGITDPYFENTYYYYSEQVQLLKKNKLVFNPNNNGEQIVTSDTYSYSPSNNSVSEVTSLDSRGMTTTKTYKYPSDFSSSSPYSDMIDRNIISPVIEQSAKNITSNRELSKEKTNYSIWQGSLFVAPSSTQSSHGGNPLETDITVNKYDSKGNLLETISKGGITTSYIWGYSSQYLVAKVIGSDYNVVKLFFNQSVIDNSTTTDMDMRTELNKIRTGLIGTNAQVITYTYAPLIGMTSETDPNGRTTYYEYDGFNRLSLVRDKDNNIIKKICYNYAGQPEACVQSLYYNTVQSKTFTRNNCATGATGSEVTYTVPANRYSSATSQEEADQKAKDEIINSGQNYANNNGYCTYYSAARSDIYTRNNCGSLFSGGQATYTVAAGKYTSTISQAEADAQAEKEIKDNGQEYANNNATCTPLKLYPQITYENICYDAGYADVVVRFYADPGFTIPATATNYNLFYIIEQTCNSGYPMQEQLSEVVNGSVVYLYRQANLYYNTIYYDEFCDCWYMVQCSVGYYL